MSKPQVTLTLAGDESKLEKTFGAVGASSKKLADDVGASSKRVADETSSAYDRAGEAADNVDTKAMGFRDTLTGVQDTMKGTSMIAKGDLFNGFFTLGAGLGDLGSGFYNFLIPAMKAFSKEAILGALNTGRQTAATAASKVATLASAAATNVMTVAQKALNLAMRMNPIGLIITAVLLLVGAVVLAYKHSETFRRIVDGAFRAVKTAAQFAFNWVRDNWKLLLGIVTGPIGLAVLVIGKHKESILGFFKGIPGAIKGYFSGLASTIKAPFSAAFSGIKSAWNNTVGGKGFSVPGWIPGLGGKDFRIPYFHTGGIVSGAMGSETLAVLKAGERVTGGRGSGGGVTIVLQSDGTAAGTALMEVLRKAIKITAGGDVQVALGQ
jgi:hypothetical protein